MRIRTASLLALVSLAGLCCFGQRETPLKQQVKSTTPADVDSISTLAAVSTITVPSEPAAMFVDPFHCDADGNLYLRPYRAELGLAGPVKKFDRKGNLIATFPVEAIPNFKTRAVAYFAVGTGGDVYELLFPHGEVAMYVAAFGKDGSFKSNLKLDANISGSQLAVFPSGELLVSGLERTDETARPAFTGIFKADGTLVKRIALEDDKKIQAAVEVGDSTVSDPTRPGSNLAVNLGQAMAGEDGNIYLMRRTAPVLIYAISPAGAVVRRIEVASPDHVMMPVMAQASANRLVVLFRNEHTNEQLLKIIDMQSGDLIAQYKDTSLGGALACYLANDNRFIFLTNTKEKLAFNIAEPR